jgi:hypothetical protein
MLKVVSIVVKDNTNEIVLKLKKINDLYEKLLDLQKCQKILEGTKEELQKKIELSECRCQHKLPVLDDTAVSNDIVNEVN